MVINRIRAAVAAATISIATIVVSTYEGIETKAYLDPVGIPTICYGHTATAKHKPNVKNSLVKIC